MDDTVHRIIQSRILEWVAFHFSRGSSQPMNRTQVSLFAARFFNIWASREALESLICLLTSFSKIISQTCLVAQMVKRLSTMREILIRAVGWEDPLKKEMAIHSSTSAWRIPWTEEPGRLQGCKESDTTERLRSVKDYFICDFMLFPLYTGPRKLCRKINECTVKNYENDYCHT